MTAAPRQQRFRIVLSFALVYVFWGSTYLAIRVGVEHIPPELMTAMRYLVAGPVMLAACAVTRRRVALSGGDLVRQATVGILMLSMSNTTLTWAEQYVRTGLASLIVASVPIWFLVLDTWVLRGDRLSSRGLVGLGLGVIGIVVLLWPKLNPSGRVGSQTELVGSLALVGASFVWATGSVLSRRWQNGVDAFTATGWQMTAAGALNLGISLLLGEPARTKWVFPGLAAVAYLIVFGSWVGYSAYIWLLNNVPTSKVGTYAYVNPVIAVFLGWIFLHEKVDGYILAGTVIVIVAVALATTAKVKARDALVEKEPKLPACEQGAD